MYRDKSKELFAELSPTVLPDEYISFSKLKKICESELVKKVATFADFYTYTERLKHELPLIEEKKLSYSFLAMREFINNLNTKYIVSGIPNNSLVLYLLGITSLDPIICKLPFERYLQSWNKTNGGWFILILPDYYVKNNSSSKLSESLTKNGINFCEDSKNAILRIIPSEAINLLDQIPKSGEVPFQRVDTTTMKFIKDNFAHFAEFVSKDYSPLFLKNYPLDTFEDLIFLCAFANLAENMHNSSHNGEAEIEMTINGFSFPIMKDLLKETHGVLAYQEQFSDVMIKLGGFAPTEAELCRRKLGRRINDVDEYKEKFKTNLIKEHNFTKNDAEQLWDELKNATLYTIVKSVPISEALLIYKLAEQQI